MRFPSLVLALFALLLAGCSEQATLGGRPAPKVWTSAVSLSPSLTEIASLHTKLRLAGRTSACNYPPNVVSLPVMMNGVKPDYEAIQKAGASVVLYDKQLFSDADLEPLKSAGVDTFGLTANTLDGFVDELYQLGALTASESKMSEYVDLIHAAVGVAKAAVGDKKPKVAILLGGEGGEHMICGVKSFQADILKTIGAVPVGPDADNFVPVNAEWLVSQNPDVIITASHPDVFMADKRLSSIKAIKTGMVRGLLPDLVLRKGARVERLIRRFSDAITGAK